MMALRSKVRLVRKDRKVKVEDEVDTLCNNVIAAVDGFGRTASKDAMLQKVRTELDQIETRIVPRQLDKLMEENKLAIVRISEKHVVKFLEILDKYMDSTEHEYLIGKLQELCDENQVDKFIEEDVTDSDGVQVSLKKIMGSLVGSFLKEVLLLPFQKAGELIAGNKDIKANIREDITKFKNRFNIDELIERLTNLDDLESRINELMFENFLNPIEADLKQIIENREGREKQRAEATAKLDSLQKQKKEYEAKVASLAL